MKGARFGLGALLLAIIAVFAAEVAARIEDRLRDQVPVLAAPDRERDLVEHDAIAIRGKPDGRYKQWHLNQFGFRNGRMTESPLPGCVRVMALGASETFGMYEAAGMEYPAQLEYILDSTGNCHEVVNAAIVGLTLRGVIRLWTNWASRFGAHIVVVYPTPAFYLGDGPPQYPGPPNTRRSAAPAWTSRLLDRARDRIDYPDLILRYRVRRTLDAASADRQPDWFFRTTPQGRVAQFKEDLERLVLEIRSRGAYPLILTHATAFHNPPRPEEISTLDAWRALQPKPTTQVLLDFEDAARRETLSVARSHNVTFIDLAGLINGRADYFAEDYIHFSERGAKLVAELIAAHVASMRIPQMQAVHAVQ